MGQALHSLPSQAPPGGHGRSRNPRLSDPSGRGGTRSSFHANVALQALLFLYRDVLKQPFPELGDIEHAKKSRRVPVVFARQEVIQVLAHLVGLPHLMASLLYGSGLRLMECVRLRVKDVDFAYH
jgi:integrase